MDLTALLNYPGALPAMSRTVTDLMAEMNKDDPDPRKVGELIVQVLDGLAGHPEDNSKAERAARAEVEALCRRFPIYPDLL